MTDIAYYLSFVFTLLAAIFLFLFSRSRIKAAIMSEASGKNLYTFVMPLLGALSGLLVFPSLVSIFRLAGATVHYGHGEVLIAAPVFNFLFASVLALVGRIVLGWRAIKW